MHWLSTNSRLDFPAILRYKNVFIQRCHKSKIKDAKKLRGYLDRVTLRIQAGKGGDGCVHFDRAPFRPIAPPDGGDGGNGSNIWVEVIKDAGSGHSIFQSSNKPFVRVSGDEGAKGIRGYGKGKSGRDIFIYLPKGTILQQIDPPGNFQEEHDDEIEYPQEKVYIDTSHPRMPIGTKFLIAAGGQGGVGNARLSAMVENRNISSLDLDPKTSLPPNAVAQSNPSNQYSYATKGQPAPTRYFSASLKTISDVGLIGMPNAGKSSFLRAMLGDKKSRSEVADYAFTTLRPFVGTLNFDQQENLDPTLNLNEKHGSICHTEDYALSEKILPPLSMKVADLPGIIKGAAKENRGLGNAFLKHAEKCDILVYIVDLTRENPIEDLRCLIDELEAYKQGLSRLQTCYIDNEIQFKGGIILANKADEKQSYSSNGSNVDVGRNYVNLRNFVHELTGNRGDDSESSFESWHVIPISAKFNFNIDCTLQKMRHMVHRKRITKEAYWQEKEQVQIHQYGQIVEPLWKERKYLQGILQIS